MRNLLAPLALMLAAASPASADTRVLSGFTSVAASSGIEVELAQGPQFAVSVEGHDADRVVTQVSGRWLNISRRGWFSFGPGPKAIVHVTLPAIEALSASSGAQMRVEALESQRLAVNAAQGAEISAAHVRVATLTMAASQGGVLDFSGACTSLDVRAAMGGVIDAGALSCTNANARASMGGTVEIHASGDVEASASMGGTIDVAGAPQHHNSSSIMGGQIAFN